MLCLIVLICILCSLFMISVVWWWLLVDRCLLVYLWLSIGLVVMLMVFRVCF